ncbi:NUDIX hydrolase [Fodinibius halophilus]|uniref:NUDIX domain-containing protein n=1 Tax=Fodinibius halophilus TaxID=1736908 RepID=A0A6M1T8Q1_9BACT|nr:NUDIX domain-containing protein [Fodinibius halophilus]NGP88411.1 NUDIX domain-containing protein [Fodinibius halophilus]
MSDIEPITAAGGVLFKDESEATPPQIVLIYRRGVWDLPKGKIEEGESIEECAVREVAEEIGLSELPNIVGGLQQTYHEYEQDGTCYGKTTYWFVMQYEDWCDEHLKPQAEEGIEQVQWAFVNEAIGKVGYANLEEVLTTFASWISSAE